VWWFHCAKRYCGTSKPISTEISALRPHRYRETLGGLCNVIRISFKAAMICSVSALIWANTFRPGKNRQRSGRGEGSDRRTCAERQHHRHTASHRLIVKQLRPTHRALSSSSTFRSTLIRSGPKRQAFQATEHHRPRDGRFPSTWNSRVTRETTANVTVTTGGAAMLEPDRTFI
jgi:hypothetical protein